MCGTSPGGAWPLAIHSGRPRLRFRRRGMRTRMRGCTAIAVALFLLGVPVALRADSSNGALKVTSFPSGANVSVDDMDTGKVTPMSISVAVGMHTVVVSIPNSGWSPDSRPFVVVAGNNDLSVNLLPNLTIGPIGPQGPTGPPGINNQGAWNSTTAYNQNDAVFDAGSYWLATASNTGSAPSPTNTSWQILAVGINNRRVWQSTLAYNANDAVTDAGSFWLALGTNANSEPSSSNSLWLQLAAQVATGATGDTGPTGAAGATGPAGASGISQAYMARRTDSVLLGPAPSLGTDIVS